MQVGWWWWCDCLGVDGGCAVGGAANPGSTAVCVVLVCSLGESLLGGALQLRWWYKRCCGVVSALGNLSNVPPTQVVSRRCVVSVVWSPSIASTICLLGDALRPSCWHTGVGASSRPHVPLRMHPPTQVVS